MYVYFMDCDTQNPLAASSPADFDYQAEQWVQDVASGYADAADLPVVAFVLCDSQGIRCVWTRSVEDAQENNLPIISKVAERFTGEWKHDNVPPVSRIEPVEIYEYKALERHKLREQQPAV